MTRTELRALIEPLSAEERRQLRELLEAELTNGEAKKAGPTFPLRGKPLRYDDPFEPAAPLEDWEALK